MPTYQLASSIYLDSQQECYKKIILINEKPTGPLLPLVKTIRNKQLSPFQTPTNCCPSPYCQLGILDPNNPTQLLCMDNIATLFSFLTTNGYTIEHELTKIMQLSTQKIDKLISYISI